MAKNRNLQFSILSSIAMTLVLLGHLDWNILDMGGIFPYYSYHVLIFVFISGYFYKTDDEENVIGYIGRKAKRLLFPYFLWNVFYGCLATYLHTKGFAIGQSISLWNLFIEPFLGGHQFMYNAAAWFVPALFLLELCNIVGRRILHSIKIDNEYLIMAIYLTIGILSVYLAKRGSVYDYYRLPARLMLMAPAFQFGHLYAAKLEKWDITPSIIFIPLLFAVNLIVGYNAGGLAYSVVWVTGFANTPLTPFITAFTGIMLWLRISRIIAFAIQRVLESGIANSRNPVIKLRSFLLFYGNNTYSVMMHHLFVFFLSNTTIAQLNHLVKNQLAFDDSIYRFHIYYVPEMPVKLLYVLQGVSIPLLVAYFTIKNKK